MYKPLSVPYDIYFFALTLLFVNVSVDEKGKIS